MEANNDLQTLIVRKLEGIITPEELDVLKGMLSSSRAAAEEYELMEAIWKSSPRIVNANVADAERRWQRLQSRIETPIPTKRISTSWLRYAAAVAFFLMVAFGYFFITKDKWVKVVTKSSDTKSITLPDSSVITLGKNTELSYNASDWSSDRSIHLDGEAFFEVKRNGNSFIVESSNARVTVLGTSFKVTSKRQHTAVTCFTGKVSVTNKDAEHEVILTRGLQTIVNNDEVAQPYAAADDTLIEDLNFKNTPLSIVFQSIARYHGTRIIINADVNEVSFTGNLKEISLESALRTVCLSAGLEYELSKDSITVKRP